MQQHIVAESIVTLVGNFLLFTLMQEFGKSVKIDKDRAKKEMCYHFLGYSV